MPTGANQYTNSRFSHDNSDETVMNHQVIQRRGERLQFLGCLFDFFASETNIFAGCQDESTPPPLHPRTDFLGERPEISIVVGVFVSKQSGNLSASGRETASNRLFLCKENSYSEKERETGRGRGEREGFQLVGGCGLEGVQFEVLTV